MSAYRVQTVAGGRCAAHRCIASPGLDPGHHMHICEKEVEVITKSQHPRSVTVQEIAQAHSFPYGPAGALRCLAALQVAG